MCSARRVGFGRRVQEGSNTHDLIPEEREPGTTLPQQLSVETDAPVQSVRSERRPLHVWAKNTMLPPWWLGVRRGRGAIRKALAERAQVFRRAALTAWVFSGPMNSPVTCGAPGHRRYGGGLMAVSNSTLSPSDVPLGRGWK
jgi:hypothetical protein